MNHSELSWITRLVAGAELDQANTALDAANTSLQQTRAALANMVAAAVVKHPTAFSYVKNKKLNVCMAF